MNRRDLICSSVLTATLALAGQTVFASGFSEALLSPVAQAISAVSRQTVSQFIETGMMGIGDATTTATPDAEELKSAPVPQRPDR